MLRATVPASNFFILLNPSFEFDAPDGYNDVDAAVELEHAVIGATLDLVVVARGMGGGWVTAAAVDAPTAVPARMRAMPAAPAGRCYVRRRSVVRLAGHPP